MSQIYEKEKHTIEELDQRLQESALHYTTDKINSKLKRSSQELEEVIEEKTRQIPPAIEPEPINIPDDCLQLVECEVTKTKRKRGLPKKAVVPKINAKEKKKYNMLPNNMRNLLKADKQEGKTLAELSEKYNVSISTVSKIVHEEEPPKQRGGKVYEKITKEASKKMAEIILRKPTVTAKELASSVADVCTSQPSASAIAKHLKSKKMEEHECQVFSVKRLRKYEKARADEKTMQLRKEYVQRFLQKQVGGKMIIYIDETGFKSLELQTEGRSPVGQRCIQYRDKTKVETVTAITAICEFFEITHVTFVDGTVNDQSFRVFLLSLMEKLQIFEKNSCVFVMDNVGLHKTKEVTDLISSKNYEVLYTAPNSCELNPIEYVFGIWKSRLSIPKTVRTSEQLITHLNKSLANITRTEVASCINMVKCHYLPLAQQGKDLSEVFNFQRLDDGEIRIEDITDELEDNQIVPCSSASASASSAVSPCYVHHSFEQVNAHFSSQKDPELPSSVIEVPDSNSSQETIHENEKNNDMDVD